MDNKKNHAANDLFNNRTIILVNTGSPKKRFIIQKLKKMGLNLVVLNKEKNWAAPYVDHWILVDNTNHNEALSVLKEFLTNHPEVKPEGVLTFWEDDILLTSKIVDKFNFIGISHNIAKKVRNKYLFRQFCQEHNLPTPRYHQIKKESDLKHIWNNFAFPVVIKPAFGSSSAYVVKVEKPENLPEMYHYVKNNLSSQIESALNDGLDILVEEFIDGDEVDIDLILQNGKIKFQSISDNYNKSKDIFFIDSGQAIPSGLPVHIQEEIIEMAEATLEKLGLQNGCIHFEAKYSSRGFYPIEINLRLGGDYVYSYNKSAWGVDLLEQAVKIALGEYLPKIHLPIVPKKYIIGWDIHPEESGVLVELENHDTLRKNKNVEEIEIYKKIGDPILVPPEGFEHLGWLTVTGENILDAKDNLGEILKLISYKVVKFDSDSALGKTKRKNRYSPAIFNKNFLIRAAKIEALKQVKDYDIRQLRIGILSNINDESSDPIIKQLTLSSLAIKNVLERAGYRTILINLNNFLEALDTLKRSEIDLIFNLGSELYSDHAYKPQIAAVLESLRLPYTGSNFFTLALARDKIRFKKILAYHNIPTPPWDYLYELNDELAGNLQYPLIVKPAWTDHCLGISQESVVINKEELARQARKIILELKSPALVEEYIEGDEYEVYILGNEEKNIRVLPLERAIFNPQENNSWHIHTYQSQWQNNALEQNVAYQLPPKNIGKKIESLITEIALDTYNIIDGKDYSKVEVKVDKNGNPYVLEINPTPWLIESTNHGLAAAAKLAGINFTKLLEEIIQLSLSRFR